MLRIVHMVSQLFRPSDRKLMKRVGVRCNTSYDEVICMIGSSTFEFSEIHQIRSLPVANLAVGGTRSDHWIGFIASSSIKGIVVYLGINDVLQERSFERIHNALCTLCDNNTHCEIALVKLITSPIIIHNNLKLQLDATNNMMENIAKCRSHVVVWSLKTFEDADFSHDGLHLNEHGNEVLQTRLDQCFVNFPSRSEVNENHL